MAKFYCSDSGRYEIPNDKGYYIGYSTKSGDSSYLGPYEVNMTMEEAQSVLERDADWEWDDGIFYAWVNVVDFTKGRL
jgi:hypothetical protein